MDSFIDGNKYIFTTQRLALRPLCVGDLKTAHKYACDVENTKYMMFLPNKTESETLAFLQSVEKEWSKPVPRSYEFAICLNGRHIGAIGIYLESDESGELGWTCGLSTIVPEPFTKNADLPLSASLWR